MLRSETLELCIFNPAIVDFWIQGSFPKFSLSPAHYRIVDTQTDIELFRVDSMIGLSPTQEMIGINQTFNHPFSGPDATVKIEINLPDDASTIGTTMKATILLPVFEPSPIFDGVDLRCIQSAEPPPLSISGFDVFSRIDQSFGAQVLVSLTTSSTDVQSLFDALRPRVELVQIVANDLTTDHGWVLVRQDDVVWIGKLGTQTAAQLIEQAALFAAGPVPIGGVGTINLYASAALDVLSRGIQPQGIGSIRRLVLVGHSLGGASMSVLGAFVRQLRPDLPIDILTFGSPKPGDAALARTQQQFSVVRVENDDDPIPFLPPSKRNLNPAAQAYLGSTIVANFGLFAVPRGRLTVFADGVTAGGGAVAGDVLEISDLTTAWAGDIGELPPAAHDIGEYLRRLRL